jgi:hypothetical protein
VPTPSANHTPSATNQVLRESIVLVDTGAQQLRSYTGRLLSRGGASAVASARLARRATRDGRARARRSQFVQPTSSTQAANGSCLCVASKRASDLRCCRCGYDSCCHKVPGATAQSRRVPSPVAASSSLTKVTQRLASFTVWPRNGSWEFCCVNASKPQVFRTRTNGAFQCVASS